MNFKNKENELNMSKDNYDYITGSIDDWLEFCEDVFGITRKDINIALKNDKDFYSELQDSLCDTVHYYYKNKYLPIGKHLGINDEAV